MPKGIYKRKPLSPERKAQAIKNIAPHQFKKGHAINAGSFKIGHKTNVGKSRIISEDHKQKIKNSCKGKPGIKGALNHCWKGGITPANEAERRSTKFKRWRESVFARDNWTCQKYLTRGGKIHPHHIKGFSQYPKLRYLVDNGCTLSEKAHKEFHKKYGYKNNTLDQLIEFINA